MDYIRALLGLKLPCHICGELCHTCGDTGMVQAESPSWYYWFCGCKGHTWCPYCTGPVQRFIERLVLIHRNVTGQI